MYHRKMLYSGKEVLNQTFMHSAARSTGVCRVLYLQIPLDIGELKYVPAKPSY